MDYKTNVGFINTHSKRICRYYHSQLISDPGVLFPKPINRWYTCMIKVGLYIICP
ncbi:hypothetical protein D3C72_1068940 [compost metagenome]